MKKLFAGVCAWLLHTQVYAQVALVNDGASLKIENGSYLIIAGDFQNKAGSNLQNDGTLKIGGIFTNDQVIANYFSGTLAFNGKDYSAATQVFSGIAPFLAHNVEFKNQVEVSLSNILRANGEVRFTDGLVTPIDDTKALVIADGGTVTVDNGYVNGRMIYEGTGYFLFPVGNAAYQQPIGISLTSNATGFSAKYHASDAGNAPFGTGGSNPTPLIAYNKLEYWEMSPLTTATGTVKVFWDGTNNVGINNINDLTVAHLKNGNWVNEGANNITGAISTGSVTSNSLSSWSPITLGSINITSALPLAWIKVAGTLDVKFQPVIYWKVQEQNVELYTLEKSLDGSGFAAIGTTTGRGDGEHEYNYVEKTALYGTAFYRIKQYDRTGKSSYSSIIKLEHNISQPIVLYPNPVQDILHVSVPGDMINSECVLTDALGKKLGTYKIQSNNFTIHMANLSAGSYFLKFKNDISRTILKQ